MFYSVDLSSVHFFMLEMFQTTNFDDSRNIRFLLIWFFFLKNSVFTIDLFLIYFPL